LYQLHTQPASDLAAPWLEERSTHESGDGDDDDDRDDDVDDNEDLNDQDNEGDDDDDDNDLNYHFYNDSPEPPTPGQDGNESSRRSRNASASSRRAAAAAAVTAAATITASGRPTNTRLVAELVAMGFPSEWCSVALEETANDVAAASTWIVDNLDTLTRMDQQAAAAESDESIARGRQRNFSRESDLDVVAGEGEGGDEEEGDEEGHEDHDEEEEDDHDDGEGEGDDDDDDDSGDGPRYSHLGSWHTRPVLASREEESFGADFGTSNRRSNVRQTALMNAFPGLSERRRSELEARLSAGRHGNDDDDDDDDEERLLRGSEVAGMMSRRRLTDSEWAMRLHGHGGDDGAAGAAGEGAGDFPLGQDRFGEELAADVYMENYFPGDPGLAPGGSYHGGSSFGYGSAASAAAAAAAAAANSGSSGTGMDDDLDAMAMMAMSGRGCAKAAALEASNHPTPLLPDANVAAETSLAVLLARVSVLAALQAAASVNYQVDGEKGAILSSDGAAADQDSSSSSSRVALLADSTSSSSSLAMPTSIGNCTWSSWAPVTSLLLLVRLTALRGPQLRPSPQHAYPLDLLMNQPHNTSSQLARLPSAAASVAAPVAAAPQTTTGVVRALLASLLAQETSTATRGTGREHTKDTTVNDSSSSKQQQEGNLLATALLNAALDDLETCALVDVFADTPWTKRSLAAIDAQAALQPSAELAFWLMDLLLAQPPSSQPSSPPSPSSSSSSTSTTFQPPPQWQCNLYGPTTCTRLGLCLRASANMPVKEISMRCLTRILVKWCDALQIRLAHGVSVVVASPVTKHETAESSEEVMASTAAAAANTAETITGTPEKTKQHLDHHNYGLTTQANSCPSAKVMRALIARSLPSSLQYQLMGRRRLVSERAEERLFASKYTQAAVELVTTLDQLEDLLAVAGGETKMTSSYSSGCEEEKSTGEGVQEAPSSSENVRPPLTVRLVAASEDSLAVAWSSPSSSSTIATSTTKQDEPLREGREGGNPNHGVRYELQFASPLPGSSSGSIGSSMSHRSLTPDAASSSVMFGSWQPLFKGSGATSFPLEHLSPRTPYRFRLRALYSLSLSSSIHEQGSSNNSNTSNNETTSGPWSEPATFETLCGAAFTFDRASLGSSVFVSGSGLQATYGANEAWKTVLGTQPFSYGCNRWEIRLDASATAYLFIGAATRQADLTTFLGGDDFGWGYIGDRALYHKRTKVKVYGERFGEGDVVGVTMDLDKGTLSFSKNGVDLGVAFEGLGAALGAGGDVYPAVAFYNSGQQVSLLPHSFVCPGSGAASAVAEAPACAGITEASDLSAVLGSCVDAAPLPDGFLQGCFQEHRAWARNECVRYHTRAGYDLTFDTSSQAVGSLSAAAAATAEESNDELDSGSGSTNLNDDMQAVQTPALPPNAMRAWERVRTPRGPATVVGACGGLLWLHVDGERGAWFVTKQELQEGVPMGFFVGSGGSDISGGAIPSGPTMPLSYHGAENGETKEETSALGESKEEDTCDMSNQSVSAVTAAPTANRRGSNNVSLFGNGAWDRFRSDADSPKWGVQRDALLIEAINAFCDKQPEGSAAGSPWNLTPPQVSAIVQDPALLRQLMAAQPSPSSSPFYSAARTNDFASVREVQRAALARLVVLRRMNALLSRALPLIGLEDALLVSSRPPPQASLWGHPSELHGPQVIGQLSPSSPAAMMPAAAAVEGAAKSRLSLYSRSGGLGLGPLLCACRALVFTATKTTLVQEAMLRTVTPTKKADDDYDYPEDLPQVVLNRPKAAAGRNRRDPEVRLKLSLFGQLFDELHSLDPSVLRLGYTHPMDDGQSRAFKVKFEGEGVDDYGGPYREIFSQIAAEVQALGEVLRAESRESFKHATRCALPLLRPAPNAAVDDATTGQDVLIPQPGLVEGTYLDMYHFLGQFLGMALRSRIAIKVKFPPHVWKSLVGEPLSPQSDLKAFDEPAAAMVAFARRTADEMTAAATAASYDGATIDDDDDDDDEAPGGFTWSAVLSGGMEVPLASGGSQRMVRSSPSELYAWANALEWQRLHESDSALFAIRDGLCSVVPAHALSLLCGRDLERLVCGRPEILDLNVLAANTEYDDDMLPDSATVRRLWRVLETFNFDERSAFLRFVWARARLPSTSADFTQKFKVQAAVGEGPTAAPDKWLPKAHTCFFSLNLPHYTSDAVMAKQLRYAVFNCVEMDADFKLADKEMTGWDEADDVDDPY